MGFKFFARSQLAMPRNSAIYMTPSETGLDGPDQILQAEDDTTSVPEGRVRIMCNENDLYREAISVPGLLARSAKQYGDRLALVACPGPNGEQKTWTFKEYETEVKIVARAFLKLGLERHHSVAILGFNTPQWFISELAAMYAGGIVAGIYTTNSAEACYYCAESSRANIIVVDDEQQLAKILEIRHRLPKLKTIIQYDGIPKEENVYSWDDVLAIGRAEPEEELNAVLKRMGVNECCALVYTSGTTGMPKAVMLSHDNLVTNCHSIAVSGKFLMGDESLVTYLPLSHVAAQSVDIFGTMRAGATVYFADKNALKGTLINTLVASRPTQILAVPRVYEKIYEKMMAVAKANGSMKTWIATWAKSQGLQYNINRMNGNDYKHWGYLVAKFFIFDKVKAALGLDRCRNFFTGAAPINDEIQRYFMSLDMPLTECYGMSESSGPHTLSTRNNYKLKSMGPVMNGFSTRIDNPDESGEGEICMRGRHIFMGYLNDPEKTKETKDEDGWLHTGDLGRLDADGFVSLTGRIKELIITAGGENIAPVPIEQRLLAELPALSNAMLIGDARKFLTILVTLKTDMVLDTGAPTDTLTEPTRAWAESIGSKSKTVTEVLNNRDPAIYQEIEAALKRANSHAISNAQKIQKFRILPNDFSMPTGELGPTFKVRRNIILTKYKDLIDEMYK